MIPWRIYRIFVAYFVNCHVFGTGETTNFKFCTYSSRVMFLPSDPKIYPQCGVSQVA